MTGQLTTYNSTPTFLDSLKGCYQIERLLNWTRTITTSTANELYTNFKRQPTYPETEHSRKRQLITHLAKQALRAGNISKTLNELMDAYEQRPSDVDVINKIKRRFYSSFYTYEEHLTPCDFNSDSPIPRERHVVCQQVINFFAEQYTSTIFQECGLSFSTLNDAMEPYQSLGAYIVASEDASKKTNFPLESSWDIRDFWNKGLREQFCLSNSFEDRKQQHCQDPTKQSFKKDQKNLEYWAQQIWPNNQARKVYTSNTIEQIRYELDRRKTLIDTARSQTKLAAENITSILKRTADRGSNRLKENQLTEKILRIKNKLNEAFHQFSTSKTPDNFKACKHLALEAKELLTKHGLTEKYPEVSTQSQACLDSKNVPNDDL